MIGAAAVFALATAIWFFRTARKVGRDAWVWAFIGFACFQGFFALSAKIFVIPMSLLMPTTHDNDATLTALVWIVALAMSWFASVVVRAKYLTKKTTTQAEQNE